MTVYRPGKSPYYHYDFKFKGERYHGSTGLTSKTEAKRKEADIRREIASGTKVKPSITVDGIFGIWWEEKGRHEANSATTKGQAKRLIKALGANKAVADVTDGDFKSYVAKRRAMKNNRGQLLANATVNREIELCGRVWRNAQKRYAVSDIEWTALKLKEAEERVREMGAGEECRFWETAPSEDLAAVAEFALLSGQRKSSVITLLRSKVFIPEMRAEVRVKGNKWHSFPLTPRMLDIIRAQPKVGPFVFTYVCERPAPPRGDRPRRLKGHRYPFSKQGWDRKWRKWLKDAEIDDFRFHDLRHTRGTRLLRATGNLKVVQRLLGHTNITTTARYAHALDEDVRKGMIEAESRNSPELDTAEVTETPRNARDTA